MEEMTLEQEIKLTQEIHRAFDQAVVDVITAPERDLPETFTDQELSVVNNLEDLGFSRSATTQKLHKKGQALRQYTEGLTKKKKLGDANHYFTMRYPNYRMIDYNSVRALNEKYNLVTHRVKYFTGEVPVDQVERMSQAVRVIKDEDWLMTDTPDFNPFKPYGFHRDTLYADRIFGARMIMGTHGLAVEQRKAPLLICAPASQFDREAINADERALANLLLDPIVLAPVVYQKTSYYLILAAWGPEASDPAVVNSRDN